MMIAGTSTVRRVCSDLEHKGVRNDNMYTI